MKRRVFYSFHYQPDSWRAGQVRSIGAVEGNEPASDNDWEIVKKGGDAEIKRWISDQMRGRSCTVVLVGSKTADRPWINYEICKSWEKGMGVVGIYIHGLKNADGKPSQQGSNPFDFVKIGQQKLSSVVKCYPPTGSSSREKYAWIVQHLANAIEEAIRIRNQWP